jgi:hypothetical protein
MLLPLGTIWSFARGGRIPAIARPISICRRWTKTRACN